MTADVELTEHLFIPLPDGTRLAARLWLPSTAHERPVPALLEYLPYRKTDGTAPYDPVMHGYFARHGYASVRVDMRGSGDSDGLLTDEYTQAELDDALHVIAWLAAQRWCSGKVGMFGISWGGFNALQVAALRPPALGAIVTACSTDDRYADDVHYMGGCIEAIDVIGWATNFTSMQARPPSPLVRADWRERWLERLDALPLFAATWLEHQTRDAYWRHGSVCEDYAAIRCPVFAVGGWADGYKNTVLRLLSGLSVPRKGLIGPWAHGWPNRVNPEPRIAFSDECVRWWDRWLKDVPNGADEEPMLRAWEQDAFAPDRAHATRPGRWIAERAWPPADGRIEAQRWYWTDTELSRQQRATNAEQIPTDLRHGCCAGTWCPFGTRDDLPGDERNEAGCAERWTVPADAPQSILGRAKVHVSLAVDRPVAHVAVRLCDVHPDGTVQLVTRGVLNLGHRDNHARVEPLAPDSRLDVIVELDACAHRLERGHRWQLAIAPTYWPLIWPTPEPVTLTLLVAVLELPLRNSSPLDAALRPLGTADGDASLAVETVAPFRSSANRGALPHAVTSDRATEHAWRLPDGLTIATYGRESTRATVAETIGAEWRSRREVTMSRGDWQTKISVDATLRAELEVFVVEQVVEAYEGATRLRRRTWQRRIPRNGT